MHRQTILAILQQSEYDDIYFNRWWRDHHQENDLISPKKWTTKLRLIDQMSRLFFWLPAHQQILTASWLLSPADWVTKSAWLFAAKIKLLWLKKRGLKIIAFSGSYGKTSTKKIAQHLLNAQTATLATPKSINTLLGISQFILKNLTGKEKVFLVELGEYYPGDIATLTRFIEPDLGVVCPAGRQHLERMQELSTIATTILELATHFEFNPAKVLIHESLVPFLPTGLATAPLTYGNLPASDYVVSHGKVSWAGTEGHVKLTKNTVSTQVFTPLFGVHQLVNSLPALWLAQALGLDQENAIRQLGSTPYVPHRHQPTFSANNILFLDNGYNSNPDSAVFSLELLQGLPAARRIVITPGFAELGSASEQLHEQFGRQLAQVVDYLGIITSSGSKAIIRGFLSAGGKPEQIIEASSQLETSQALGHLYQPQSVVLFENNLPEVYN